MDVKLTNRKAMVSLVTSSLADSEVLSSCIISVCYLVKLVRVEMFVKFEPVTSTGESFSQVGFVPKEDWGKEMAKALLVDLVKECFEDQDVLVHVLDCKVRKHSTFIELEFAENGERERLFCKSCSHLFKQIGLARGRRIRLQIKEKP